MRMVMVVVPRDQADQVVDSLIDAGYGVTYMDSRGGVLRQAQRTLFMAVNADQIPDVLSLIRRTCHTKVAFGLRGRQLSGGAAGDNPEPSTEVGYAVVFVWDLEHVDTY